MEPKDARIAVALSGGVDSAMAALILKEAGRDIVGLTMRTWDGSLDIPEGGRSGCFGPEEARDLEAAAETARRLGIAHHIIDLSAEYRGAVLDYFRKEYLAGRTPNPCVRCNRSIKFGALREKAHSRGVAFDLLASGHYARVEQGLPHGRFLLKRGVDRPKDQSYFLAGLGQQQLGRLLLPLGGMTKRAVKALARESGWADFADKQESQNFIEGGHYGALFEPGDARPGPIRDLSGRVVGEHKGIVRYTVGQRKHLGLGGSAARLYVVKLDACSNTVVVGPREALLSKSLRVRGINWISVERAPASGMRFSVQIRQQHRGAPASLVPRGEQEAAVIFDEPQMSATPGQTAAFYDGDTVVGAGTIEEAGP